MKEIKFEKIKNAREFGATVTKDGRTIKSGAFIRSAELSRCTDNDIRKLTEIYHLGTIIDLRTKTETDEKPDVMISGVKHFHIPVFSEEALGVTHEKNLQGIEMLDKIPDMCKLYQTMIESEHSQNSFRKIFEIITDSDRKGSVLWHCTEGKDRCGMTSVILHHLLGTPKGAIFEDYLTTNITAVKKAKKLALLTKYIARRPEKADIVYTTFLAMPEYLESFESAIEKNYGSFDNYAKEVLSISSSEMKDFRARFSV